MLFLYVIGHKSVQQSSLYCVHHEINSCLMNNLVVRFGSVTAFEKSMNKQLPSPSTLSQMWGWISLQGIFLTHWDRAVGLQKDYLAKMSLKALFHFVRSYCGRHAFIYEFNTWIIVDIELLWAVIRCSKWNHWKMITFHHIPFLLSSANTLALCTELRVWLSWLGETHIL